MLQLTRSEKLSVTSQNMGHTSLLLLLMIDDDADNAVSAGHVARVLHHGYLNDGNNT